MAVEQIARDKQTVHVPQLCLADDIGEGALDRLRPVHAPRLVAVGVHTPVDVCNVNEFHR